MKLEPLHNVVLVRRDPEEVKSKGGIYIPEQAKEKPKRGTVVAVGRGIYQNGQFIPTTVKPGDVVYWRMFVNEHQLVEVNGEKLAILVETEIIGRETR